MKLDNKGKKEQPVSKKKEYTVKNDFLLSDKKYSKGDKIELENKDSVNYLKKQHLIN